MNERTEMNFEGLTLAEETIDELIASILGDKRIRHLASEHLPQRKAIISLVNELQALVFPGFFGRRSLDRRSLPAHIEAALEQLASDLRAQIHATLCYWRGLVPVDGEEEGPLGAEETADCSTEAARITAEFLSKLPEVRRMLSLDVVAAFEGDPAAEHSDEAVFCYPGVYAIMVHRLAHELYGLGVPLLPRIMSEYAHSVTGIDIHPGAEIGESFFIDHGTGVVIGETTIIGKHCKVYQGVTLGAKSFPKDSRGRVVRGTKRHPTLGDRVTVYAGAIVLGGDTTIGDDCVISGSVFIARSVPPGYVVRNVSPELILRTNPEAAGYESDASGI